MSPLLQPGLLSSQSNKLSFAWQLANALVDLPNPSDDLILFSGACQESRHAGRDFRGFAATCNPVIGASSIHRILRWRIATQASRMIGLKKQRIRLVIWIHRKISRSARLDNALARGPFRSGFLGHLAGG
jgi:hypothetical protein